MIKRYALALSLLVMSAGAAHAQSQQPVVSDPSYQLGRDAQGNLVARDDKFGFGNPHVWAFSTDAGLQISRTTISGRDGAIATITVQPALDYFVIKNLSVGGFVGLQYQKAGSAKSTIFQIGPRVGYNFELARKLSIWPKLGFSYSHTNQNNGDDKANSLALNLFAPVMLHPAEHFFAGLGPFLDADLSGDNRATTWGIKLTLGGWIQGKS